MNMISVQFARCSKRRSRVNDTETNPNTKRYELHAARLVRGEERHVCERVDGPAHDP